MDKSAQTRYAIHDLLAQRWSPRAYADRLVEPETVGSLFEAARWAASCYNEQPWRFVVAMKNQIKTYDDVLSCLVEGNQTWAKRAPVLALGLVKKTFTRNGNPNAHDRHDLGLATAGLMVQATALDLYVHVMGGILPDRARAIFAVPDDYDIVTGLAIGYLGDPDDLPASFRAGEQEPRQRKPLAELVFSKTWGEPADFTAL